MISIRSIKKPSIKTIIPGPKSKELLKNKDEFVPQGVFNTVPTFIKRGEGAVIEDVDGNILFDFAGGIGVLNIGYSHPEVVETVKKQAENFFHSSINVVLYESYIKLAKKLCEITPGDFKKKTMLVNSGAEAVENAIKIARKYTKKSDIICFEGAFHGRTLLTMSLTSKVKPYSFGFGPFAPGIHKMPFANCYRCAYGLQRETCNLRCAERLEEMFISVVDPENVAAVILEPIQGEGGFILPPDEFITKLKNICNKHNILFIADEIQSGFCRTGKMFASEYWDVVPDIITTAKSMAGGLPISAVTARAEIFDAAHVGGIGGTFSGNPLACEAGLKVIDIMERDNFAKKAQVIGKIILSRFMKLREKYPIIGNVRGRGAMYALELVKDRDTKEPAKEKTKEVIQEAYQHGLVLLSAGLYSNVIRILVPLVVTKEQLEVGLDIIENAVKKVSFEHDNDKNQ
jgi:4-aminobutyrate aminotransferase / (S)-3-amino-2-methylpropionate transaminase / 5-aminovalerate transaminase